MLFSAEVVVEVLLASGAEDAIEGDGEDGGKEDGVVEVVHEKDLVSTTRARTVRTKSMRTKT
jgi:hypothetical protein